MHENNFPTYRFFRDWHLDQQGKDIFTYRGISFGLVYRLQIWNDFTFYVRNRICLERLRELQFEKLFAGTHLKLVEGILGEMGLEFVPVLPDGEKDRASYSFPIFRWMDEQIRTRSLRHRFRDLVTAFQGRAMALFDKAAGRHKVPAIFIQEYYPTRDLLQSLKHDSSVRLVLAHFSWATGWVKYLRERPIPVWGSMEKFQGKADRLLRDFHERRCAQLVLSNGIDLTKGAYDAIETRIASRTAETLRTLDCVITHLDRSPIRLAILIANIGLIATLVYCVCRTRSIPSYLIINGFMSGDFLDDGKYATVINAYSRSIKENYFRGMDNIVCLGDPRMDHYVPGNIRRNINRVMPTVTIGASGYSPVDLNSYIAVEFDFMFDVLSALKIVRDRGTQLRIVIKVRANGYRNLYQQFIDEYFPGHVDELLDVVPFHTVLDKTDLYISIYSQTHFEASCLGIPCLYYKNDSEFIDPPFDGQSELVTADSVDGLVQAIQGFLDGNARFNAFLDRQVMEKYIGPLDGGNLDRNFRYVHELLKQTENGRPDKSKAQC